MPNHDPYYTELEITLGETFMRVFPGLTYTDFREALYMMELEIDRLREGGNHDG